MSASMRGLPGRRRDRGPSILKTFTTPMDNRGRLDKHQRVSPPRPSPLQAEPEETVGGAEASIRTREDAQLMVQGEKSRSGRLNARQG